VVDYIFTSTDVCKRQHVPAAREVEVRHKKVLYAEKKCLLSWKKIINFFYIVIMYESDAPWGARRAEIRRALN
jgi:hypothetical protein